MTITREELAAFADGELSGERETEIAAAVEADPALAREIAAHRMLKMQLGDHFAPIVQEAVPAALADLLAPSGQQAGDAPVVDFAAAQKRAATAPPPTDARVGKGRGWRRNWGWIAAPALAASLALAVFVPRGGDQPPGYADERLAAVLGSQLVAGQDAAADTRILLSFRDGEGDYCRVFNGEEGGGIACRDEDGWRLEALGQGSPGARTDYRMAGVSDGALLARAQEMARGPALDAQQEARARADGWR